MSTQTENGEAPAPQAEREATSGADKRPIADVLEDLTRPLPDRFIETKPKGGVDLKYIPWHRAQRLLNYYTNGHVSYYVIERELTRKNLLMSVRIIIHAADGDYTRDGTGLESLATDTYGDPQSNAESMAFRRAAARFGLGLYLYEGD